MSVEEIIADIALLLAKLPLPVLLVFKRIAVALVSAPLADKITAVERAAIAAGADAATDEIADQLIHSVGPNGK